eukprot:TRINITY_DN21443_c0_g1_i1.p1 TRINITY_DN21443_c0_g1~~TRINITY_DN21443_c0_g1_i1.p1  ORF type:complete len:302 (-),score=44.75 TRINITY_DN21443_c0_g1_i1:528-1433(-)
MVPRTGASGFRVVERFCSKPSMIDDFRHGDEDTEVPTDSERSEASELSFSRKSTDRLYTPKGPQRGVLCDLEVTPNIDEHMARDSPLWLAVDSDDRVQVVQAAKLVSPETLALLCESRSAAATRPSQRTVPKRPPGIFFRTPPGLPTQPGRAVTSMTDVPGPLVCTPTPARAVSQSTFTWTIDARKLTSSDKVIVSPRFEFSASRIVPFRVMLCPKDVGYDGGRVSFKKARAIGNVLIKSELDLEAKLAFDVKLGDDFAEMTVEHDFSEAGMCKLPGAWNFMKAVDNKTQTITVTVTVSPC